MFEECVKISSTNYDELIRFARSNKIDLTVVGPEIPLVDGIVEKFSQNGLFIFGPSSRAAILEGSKIFSKNFMLRNNIPTANEVQAITEYANLIEAIDIINNTITMIYICC